MAWVDHAATWVDRAEEHTSHLEDIMRDMMSMPSMHFGVMGFKDMLAHIAAPILALAPAPAPTLAPAPAPASTFGDDDDDDDDVDLGDF